MDISGFNPPYVCMARGCDSEASLEIGQQNLESGAVSRTLRLCERHAKELEEHGTIVTGQ